MSFTAAIVGRPNVGKSTLFNRLVGQRLALVDDRPGVTRDRRRGAASLGGLDFTVIDTAGLEESDDATLVGRMRQQTLQAVAQADVALLVVDARTGITPLDRHFAELLRRQPTPVLLVANKTEGRKGLGGAYEAFELGLGDPIAISAEHGEGLSDLYDALAPFAETPPAPAGDRSWATETSPVAADKPLMLAIAGRPNVGKSTLVNRLIGEERLLTGPEAGITRDAIAVDWVWQVPVDDTVQDRGQDRAIRLVDTAGLRRQARVEEKLERLSTADTLRAIRFAELVVLVVDALNPLEKQDLTIARMVEDEGRAMVIALNKWDAVTDRAAALRQVSDRLQTSLQQLQGIPVVPVSGLTGYGLDRLMKSVIAAHEVWNTRIPTPRLNRWLAVMQERHPPPLVEGRRLRLRYITQSNIRPPTFALFASRPGSLPEAYRRYLIHGLRDDFHLTGVPIRMMLRSSANPFAE